MPDVDRFELASIDLAANPARTRSRVTTTTFQLADPGPSDQDIHGWAFVFDVRDNPPAWFEVPSLDLQPTLARCMLDAIDRAQAALAVDRRFPPEVTAAVLSSRSMSAAHRALRDLMTGDQAALYERSAVEAVGLVLTTSHAWLTWIGTARGYLVRDGSARRLTRDHTLLEEVIHARVAEGNPMTDDEIAAFPHHGIVTRLLGTEDWVEQEPVSVDLAPGDRLVLMSGQISSSVDAETLLATLDPSLTAHQVAVEITARASSVSPGIAHGAAVVQVSAATQTSVPARPPMRS